MRTEQEIFQLALDVAQKDERIRAVALNGSRADPAAPPDTLQDYDIVYLVRDMDSFLANHSWVDVFGERIILQMPEAGSLPCYPPANEGWFTYLMLFCDGNRIDLALWPVQDAESYKQQEPYTRVLLDKDGLLAALPPPDPQRFWVKRPGQKVFADCCNEFWWVSAYVAKGLWRGQLLYATYHMEQVIAPMLHMMLEWRAAAPHNFAVDTGKNGMYLDRYLPGDVWERYIATKNLAGYPACRAALWGCVELFRESALWVAAELGLAYNQTEDERMTGWLHGLLDGLELE